MALASPAHAVSSPSEMLPNAADEYRAEAIGNQLRCLVCQNESVEQSDADLAKDLRHIIRERVAAGDTNQQVIAWMVARYGNFIRLKPPFEPGTFILWFAPLIAIGVGGAVVIMARRHQIPPATPLSAAERRRLSDLLR